MKEFLILRSVISSELMKNVLFRGFAIAFAGMFLLLAAGVFIPFSILQYWGWIIFLLSLGLIAWGLIPYRRLSRLQLKPNELILSEGHLLSFNSKGNRVLSLPFQSIDKLSYVDHAQCYGIAVWLKSSPHPLIVVYQFKEVEKLKKKGREMGNADLFFTYFNQRSYKELVEWQFDDYS